MAASVGNHSSQHLVKAFENFKKEQDNLINVKTLSTTEAEEAAKSLANTAENFRKDLLNVEEKDFHEALGNKEVPFPIAYQVIEMLQKPEIQCYDALKQEISQAARIFNELIVFQCALQERRIYTETVEKMRSSLRSVISTLPEKEVLTRFELRCAHAAIKKLDVGIGKWRQIRHQAGEDIGIALLQMACSASPTGVPLAPLVKPIVEVSKAVYSALEDRWYKSIWVLKWTTAEHCITTPQHFDTIKPLFEEHKKNPKLAIYMSQLFREIIENPKTESNLRESLLVGQDLSLLALLKLKNNRVLPKKGFWKARFCTLIQLNTLIPIEKDPLRLMNPIAEIYCNENEKDIVREKAGSVLANTLERKAPSDQEMLKIAEEAEKSSEKEAEEAKAYGVNFESLDKEIKRLGKEKEGLNKKLGESSSSIVEQSVGGQEDPQKKLQEIEKRISHYEKQQEDLNQLEMRSMAAQRLKAALNSGDWNQLRSPFNFGD